MGPRSKEAVCAALGHIIDEQQQQRGTLFEIRRLLERQLEGENEDLAEVNRRLTELERRMGGHHASPAE